MEGEATNEADIEFLESCDAHTLAAGAVNLFVESFTAIGAHLTVKTSTRLNKTERLMGDIRGRFPHGNFVDALRIQNAVRFKRRDGMCACGLGHFLFVSIFRIDQIVEAQGEPRMGSKQKTAICSTHLCVLEMNERCAQNLQQKRLTFHRDATWQLAHTTSMIGFRRRVHALCNEDVYASLSSTTEDHDYKLATFLNIINAMMVGALECVIALLFLSDAALSYCCDHSSRPPLASISRGVPDSWCPDLGFPEI